MTPKDQIFARLYVALTLLSLVPLLIVLQIVRIQAFEGRDLRAEGVSQAVDSLAIPAFRGIVVDSQGRRMAINRVRYDLAVDPGMRGFSRDADRLYRGLARLTQSSAAKYRGKVKRKPGTRYVRLATGLHESQRSEIESWEIDGIIMERVYDRRYHYGTLMSQALGHVASDYRGIAGLELQYDPVLEGRPGWREVRRDRRNVLRVTADTRTVAPIHGQTIVLATDLVRQSILEEELRRGIEACGAKAGTAIAMDPHTGAILGMASFPTYNPNRPAQGLSEASRQRAITDVYEPGSTFKLVAAIAALEQGVVALGDSIDTGDGWAVFGGRTMRDTHAHGRITFAEALIFSSNVGVATVASDLESGTLYQYARNLGFGQPTGIDLPGEVSGKLKRTPDWSGTTRTSMSIGYEVAVTPIQLLVAYAALANGGIVRQPYLVSERRDAAGRVVWTARRDSIRRAIKLETTEQLIPVFEQVVTEGTASAAAVEGLRIAGKTGTSLVATQGRYERGRTRATFVGFFPADAPTVAMVVVMDEPKTSIYGGAVSGPVFAAIARRWASTDEDLGRRLAAASEVAQPPAPKPRALARAPLPASSDVRLVSASQPDRDVMPDVRGNDAREAVAQLRRLGVDARVEGFGIVKTQHPSPGSALGPSATLGCRL